MELKDLIALIVLAVFGSIGIFFAVRSIVRDLKTQEGCSGCDGVCTTNGGYCPRHPGHKAKPDRSLLFQLTDPEAGDSIPARAGTIIAVCCDNKHYVTSLRNMRYAILYSVTKNGINNKRMLSIGDMSLEKQLHELKKARVNVLLAARVTAKEQETVTKAPLVLLPTYDWKPDLAIGTYFQSSAKAVDLEQVRVFAAVEDRMKKAYRRYPYAPGATLMRWSGTSLIYATMVTLIVCWVLIMLGHHTTFLSAMIAICFFVQAVSAGIVMKSEKIAKKKKKAMGLS